MWYSGFRHRGVRKGSYNHNDSFLETLGEHIVAFIMSLSDEEIKMMARRVENLTWVDREEGTSLSTFLLACTRKVINV